MQWIPPPLPSVRPKTLPLCVRSSVPGGLKPHPANHPILQDFFRFSITRMSSLHYSRSVSCMIVIFFPLMIVFVHALSIHFYKRIVQELTSYLLTRQFPRFPKIRKSLPIHKSLPNPFGQEIKLYKAKGEHWQSCDTMPLKNNKFLAL